MKNAALLVALASGPLAAGPATMSATSVRKLDGTTWTLSTLAGRVQGDRLELRRDDGVLAVSWARD
jgi:hypothetical protein